MYNTITLAQNYIRFKNSYNFKERLIENNRIKIKHPDKIPIICEKILGQNIPDIDKHKYLVPPEMTIGNFMCVIRKRIQVEKYDALFLFVENSIPSNSSTIGDIYYKYKDPDGFLYICYSKENTFG